jgi:hypothetical protein
MSARSLRCVGSISFLKKSFFIIVRSRLMLPVCGASLARLSIFSQKFAMRRTLQFCVVRRSLDCRFFRRNLRCDAPYNSAWCVARSTVDFFAEIFEGDAPYDCVNCQICLLQQKNDRPLTKAIALFSPTTELDKIT